jgi:uridine kinase
MGRITLIRGLPGSGKSTMAKKILTKAGQSPDEGHFEADMYFIMKDGEYHFNPALIKNAHAWCQAATREYIKTQIDYMTDDVVVSNTFVKRWEMQPYLDMANEFNLTSLVLVADGNYQNVHNVPQEVIERMRLNWEN